MVAEFELHTAVNSWCKKKWAQESWLYSEPITNEILNTEIYAVKVRRCNQRYTSQSPMQHVLQLNKASITLG